MGHNLPTIPYHRPISEPGDSPNRIFCADSLGALRPDTPRFFKFHCSEGRTPSCNLIALHDQRKRNAAVTPQRDQRYSASRRFRLFHTLLDAAIPIFCSGTRFNRLNQVKTLSTETVKFSLLSGREHVHYRQERANRAHPELQVHSSI